MDRQLQGCSLTLAASTGQRWCQTGGGRSQKRVLQRNSNKKTQWATIFTLVVQLENSNHGVSLKWIYKKKPPTFVVCFEPTCVHFSAIWLAVWSVWLSWDSRLLRIDVLSPTPFSVVTSEFCGEGACPWPARKARRRSVRERILSQTDSSSRDCCRCVSVSCLREEGRRIWLMELLDFCVYEV